MSLLAVSLPSLNIRSAFRLLRAEASPSPMKCTSTSDVWSTNWQYASSLETAASLMRSSSGSRSRQSSSCSQSTTLVTMLLSSSCNESGPRTITQEFIGRHACRVLA